MWNAKILKVNENKKIASVWRAEILYLSFIIRIFILRLEHHAQNFETSGQKDLYNLRSKLTFVMISQSHVIPKFFKF